MIRNRRIRRVSTAVMVVFGAILLFIAPEVWQGALLLVLGLILEAAGIALERSEK